MKKNLTFTKIAAIVLITSLMFSCKKDKNSDSVKSSDYINVENGTFVNSGLPGESGSNVAATITANSKALEGGSTPINVHTQSAVSHLLLGVKGSSGYYQTPVSSLQSTSDGYVAVILFNENMPTKEFTIVAEMKNEATGDIGGKTEISVSTIEQSAVGKLQVSLSWDLLNDVDLHLVEPDSNEIYYGNTGEITYNWEQIYTDHPNDYLNLTTSDLAQYIVDDSTTTGVLDLDSNPGCWIDSVNNENIIYIFPSDVKTGEYIVRVDYFSDCSVTNTTNYIVTARYDNQLITPSSGSNPYYGSFEPGTSDYGGEGDGVEVMKFNISQVKSTESNKQHIYLERSTKKTTINLDKIQQTLQYKRK